MLMQINSYFNGDLIKIETSRGANTDGSIEGSMRSLMMEGPIDVTTTEGVYRLVLKYVPFDDYDADNEGIWAISIIKKEAHASIQYPQYIDKENTGVLYIGP